MNLIEDEDVLQKNKTNKMIMIIISILIIILLIISGILLYLIFTNTDTSLKLTVDNVTTTFDDDMFVMDNGNLYIDIRAFASLLGYETFNGELKTKYSEDTTKCYISTSDESASFELNSSTIYKKVSTNDDYEYFTLENPVRLINNKLYIDEQGMEIGANCMIQYNETNNTIQVLSIDYLVSYYTEKIQNAALTGNNVDFNNKKALLYDMVLVKNSEGMYGVYSTSGTEIIGPKYTSIKFNEGSQEFSVTTGEGKMGILTSNGTTKIEPIYDSIKQISTELNYYLVENSDKYGVINENGNVVIYLEYDTIGIDETKFSTNDIDNPYILFDNCIPVERDDKWGLIDITGKTILPIEYSSIGCIVGSNGISNNVVVIPQYELIVIEDDDKYGLVDSQGNILLEPVLDSVYSITLSGEEHYYMTLTIQEEQDGKLVDVQETIDLDEYLGDNLDDDSEEEQSDETESNTIENTVQNTNVIDDDNNGITNAA